MQYSHGGTGLTTQAMQDPDVYLNAGWDFVQETDNGMEDIWMMPDVGYPQLAGLHPPEPGIHLSPMTEMQATANDGQVVSVEGRHRLFTGTTTFSTRPSWPIFPAASADDQNLMTVAIPDGQPALTTRFESSMEGVVILTRGIPDVSVIQVRSSDGFVFEDLLDPAAFSATAYRSLGRTVYGVVVRSDRDIARVSLLPLETSLMGVDIVSIVGFMQWAGQWHVDVNGFDVTAVNQIVDSIDGVAADNLFLGTTRFPQSPEWPMFPPENADDYLLESLASTENQSWFETRFAQPVTTVYLLVRFYLGDHKGRIILLDCDGKALATAVSFGPDLLCDLEIQSYGQGLKGLKITGDGCFCGVRIEAEPGQYLTLDPVVICGAENQ